MFSARQVLIRYGAYPLVMVALVIAVATAPNVSFPFLWLSMAAAIGVAAIAVVERLFPYELEWQETDADFPADAIHAVVNLMVIHAAVLILVWFRGVSAWPGIWWPSDWPFIAQVFLAGLPLDLSLYAMHRLSHRYELLWHLHSIHHSSHRLYWLNGERRHPLHAAIMAGPGLLVLGLLGAPALVVGGWFSILVVHLAFQHANLDYRVGPFRHVLGVAQLHRWHHRQRFEDAQVNFGEFWMVWDHLLGTFFDPRTPLGQIGVEGDPVPHGYADQMIYPFKPPQR
ncbi:MAG: sterol desaturase family protein [Polaromonas sp.]|nr:sterol desaturase family protein [Polaromonas sp.]